MGKPREILVEDQKKLLVISTAKHSSPSFFFFFLIEVNLSFPNGAVVKNMLANAGDARDVVSILGTGRSPGEGNGDHSSILAWKIPWTEEPGELQTMWLQRVRHD